MNATLLNPNTSNAQSPQHKYTAVGNYRVGLSVTSGAGCTDTVSHTFTINGALPQSAFIINGGNEQCSNNAVSITDNSSVDFGNLVKLEIYWNYTNDPTNKTTINRPLSGAIYSYSYPEFFSPATKIYQIKVIAYSGDNCLSASNQNITLKATPQIQFNALNNLCENAPAFQITAASVVNGMQGNGIFSGKGVSSSGIFNPMASGVGVDTIRYTFSAANGCVNYKKQSIKVFPVPKVDAGPDKFILEGGNGLLLGTASGNNISFAWAPVTGLSNANILQPTVIPTDDITYTLTVTSSDGCIASDEVFVKLLKAPTIPNTFSPNGDGVHDKWEIQYLESYPNCTIDIYNRYGQPVFYSVGYKPWDGTLKGKPLPAGTYYYIIDPKNGRKPMSGFVDIIR